jgi:hypothetical protein|tara:strand:+ start:368 stop:775 length:408 start_codon:yes stop_codon:yes gene_type:complete
MNVTDLDGNVSKWNLSGYIAKGSMSNKSSLHLKARDLIKDCHPTLQVLEEVPITPRRSETLYLDFYLPLLKTCIEVHGEQHYKFVAFYHTNKLGFFKHKKRDQAKKDWCELNDISIIELSYEEELEEWKRKINDT